MSDTRVIRPWATLAVLGVAQLMVLLDNSVVNIALPSAQRDLAFSDAARSWVVTAYALAFGSLLLLGGRLCDLLGQRTALVVGLLGFAAASGLGGLAPSFAVLVAARALQGVFAAVLAPAALSLLTATFPDGPRRARAFGIFSALSGAGAALGLLLGGALSEFVGWRWCLYVNVAFAAVALAGVVLVVPRGAPRARPPLDLVGALTATAGLLGVVAGLSVAGTDGSVVPTVSVTAGVALLGAFVVRQRRAAAPLLPLRIVLDRTRGAGLLTVFVVNVGMFGLNLFLAFILQRTLGFSPLLAGVAVLPMIAGIVAASNLVPPLLLPRLGARPLLVAGLVLDAAALWWFSALDPGTGYLAGILGPLLLMGLGLGTATSTSMNIATAGVPAADAGVASGLVNAMVQVGGAVGTALLTTIASTTGTAATALHGETTAFGVAALIFVGGAAVVGALTTGRRIATPASTLEGGDTHERTDAHRDPAGDRAVDGSRGR